MSNNGAVPGNNPYGQQPPQPPSQGYGHPQHSQVPPQGYGYPQGGQAPPVPPQGYGYPQHGQAPPIPPQGYGYQQQFPGAPVPPAQPRKKRTGLIVLLVLALLLLGGAGGGAWYVMANAATEPLWTVPAKGGWGLGETEVDGTWFTEKSVVQTLSGGVKAYDLDTGKSLWATPLPGAGNRACVAPSVSDGGIGVVAYGASTNGPGGHCDHVAAFDLNTGKVLWHRAFKVKDEFKTGGKLSLSRTGGTVVVSTDQEQVALKVADGSRAWDVRKAIPSSCESGKYTGGRNLVRTMLCREGDAFSGGKLWTEASLVDPATGKAVWTKRFGDGEAEGALTTSPLVLSGTKGTFAVDEKTGERRGTLQDFDRKYYSFSDDFGSPMRQVAGFGDILLMGVSERDTPKGSLYTLVAYDLNSGKELWKAPSAPTITYIPLRETGGKRLLAWTSKGAERPKLVEFAPGDGAMTTVAEYPEKVNVNMGVGAWPFWHKDRLYVTSVGAAMASSDDYALVVLPTTDS
ncbi:PQQ-binding-like beta-propeller repeat protein [Streptomyces sp. NPDC127084]|uniref:outer membrane protein assembly factor BamB family protein n=1 Tax=Streptomyces sp. NPDC127084 TaxID=3347133 RepID=UPI00364F3918